jgi:hypothetical protein
LAEARSLIREAEAMGRKAAAFQLDVGNIRLFDGFVTTFAALFEVAANGG